MKVNNFTETTTDKVQVGESTTGTSTSTTWYCPYTPRKAEQGWECPRCGRINAPWKSQCDCGRNNYWTVTDGWIYKPYNDELWKQVYCDPDTFKVHPETTTWKAPSSVCGSDSTTSVKSNPNSTIYTTVTNPIVGGSDYWDNMSQVWTNNPEVRNSVTSADSPWHKYSTPTAEKIENTNDKQTEEKKQDTCDKMASAIWERETKMQQQTQEKKPKKTGKYFKE